MHLLCLKPSSSACAWHSVSAAANFKGAACFQSSSALKLEQARLWVIRMLGAAPRKLKLSDCARKLQYRCREVCVCVPTEIAKLALTYFCWGKTSGEDGNP